MSLNVSSGCRPLDHTVPARATGTYPKRKSQLPAVPENAHRTYAPIRQPWLPDLVLFPSFPHVWTDAECVGGASADPSMPTAPFQAIARTRCLAHFHILVITHSESDVSERFDRSDMDA